jgi:glycerate 2-kinase
VEGVSLADLQAVMHALLNSGAAIAEINTVRKHLSQSLGGRLAAACLARVTALLISDVSGDDPAVIASGPFAPDASTFADALAILARWRIDAPASVLATCRLARRENGKKRRNPARPASSELNIMSSPTAAQLCWRRRSSGGRAASSR